MQAGAANFIETPYSDAAMVCAVRAALKSKARISALTRPRVSPTALVSLTPREHDVLNGVVDGKTNKAIARECGISPRTVEAHRASVMVKSGARSVSELVRMAVLANYPAAHGVALASHPLD
jgi:two-component system response regulator FixJ